MRAQTTLEFLAILSVTAIMVLVVITKYNALFPKINGNTISLALIANASAPKEISKPGIAIFIPQQTSVGRLAYAQIAAYNCTGFAVVSAKSSSLLFLSNITNFSVEGLSTSSLAFLPLSTGLSTANFSYSLYCQGNVSTGSRKLATYSLPLANLSSYAAWLSPSREEVIYQLSSPQPIISINESTHCTYVNFWYQPLPIQQQCGTSNAWEYRVFSSYCYYNVGGTTTTTTCIYPENTTNSTSYTTGINYSYALNLSIFTPIGVLHSFLSSNAAAPIFLYNKSVGYAKIENVTYLSSASYALLYSKNGTYFLNESAYEQYEQARSNMYSVLAFYNSTFSYSQQIDQAIYAYTQSVRKLEKSIQNASCSIGNDIVCNAQSPLYFVINAYVEKDLGLENEAMSSMGSIIRLVVENESTIGNA